MMLAVLINANQRGHPFSLTDVRPAARPLFLLLSLPGDA